MSLTNKQNEPSISSIYTEEEELFDLIHNEEVDKIREMLDEKILPIWEYKSKENQNATVLILSVYKKSLIITEILINYCKENNPEQLKEFINASNEQGVTPIHYASFRGEVQIIKLLIENGADINKKTNRNLNVIHYSAQGNKPNVLIYFYLLLKEKTEESNKYDLILEKDGGGSTSLHWAVYSLAEDYLLYLINLDIFDSVEEKINYINQLDSQGLSALHLSVSSKSPRITIKLLQNGANPLIVDNKGQNPLQLAIEKKHFEIINILKNTQKCEFCNIKAPVKQIKRSCKNIFLVFFFQIISIIILFWSTLPIFISNYYSSLFGRISLAVYIYFLIVFFILYLILLIKDPGKKPKKDLDFLKDLIDENKDLTKYCYKCFIRKTRNSRHCVICDSCYANFDHHCFWINKCVAKRNYYLFIIFLFETAFYLITVLVITIASLIYVNDFKEDKFCVGFIFDNIKNICNLWKNLLYDKFIFHLILNISLILIIVSFLIPEFLLLILHLNVCCTNYRIEKYRRKTTTSISTVSLVNVDDSYLE